MNACENSVKCKCLKNHFTSILLLIIVLNNNYIITASKSAEKYISSAAVFQCAWIFKLFLSSLFFRSLPSLLLPFAFLPFSNKKQCTLFIYPYPHSHPSTTTTKQTTKSFVYSSLILCSPSFFFLLEKPNLNSTHTYLLYTFYASFFAIKDISSLQPSNHSCCMYSYYCT